jgi:hypothetical protein
MGQKLKSAILLLLCITHTLNPVCAGISDLKTMLNNREQACKIYLPELAAVGSDLKVFVSAPGASKIILLGSKESTGGTYTLESGNDKTVLALRLGSDYREIASQNGEKAVFLVPFDRQTMEDLIGKDYFFEALAFYSNQQKPKVEKALFFGSNANFTDSNAVYVFEEKKDYSQGVSNFARSFFPGLGSFGNNANY